MEEHHHEHPFNHKGQILCFAMFMGSWILDSFVFGYSTTYSNYIPQWIRIAILVFLVLFAVILFRSVILAFPEDKERQLMDQVQKIVEDTNKQIEEADKAKEEEIMTV